MYRDDHEAALARVQALETELAAHSSDDRKIAALTREVSAARARLDHAEAELRRMRSTAPPMTQTTPTTPTTEPTDLSSHAPVVTLLLLFGGLGAVYAFGVVVQHHDDAAVADKPVLTVTPLAVNADQVVADGVSRAVELAPGAKLVTIEATGVRSDGNLDPDFGEVAVELVRDNGPEPVAQVDPRRPIGAPEPEHVYLRYDCIRFVYSRGGWQDQYPAIRMDIERLHSCVHSFDGHPPVQRRCSIAQIWDRVRPYAPATAIAKLTLDAAGWSFTIDDRRFQVYRLESDDCAR
jgi:hypothetical protein